MHIWIQRGGLDLYLDLCEKSWILTLLPSTNINQYKQGKLIVSLHTYKR